MAKRKGIDNRNHGHQDANNEPFLPAPGKRWLGCDDFKHDDSRGEHQEAGICIADQVGPIEIPRHDGFLSISLYMFDK